MNAPLLTPLALTNMPILEALGADFGFQTAAELARQIDRDKSNVAKSLKILEEAGLIEWPGEQPFYSRTVAGDAAVEAWRRAEDGAGVQALAIGAAIQRFQIFPDPENPRRDFESEEAKQALEELAASIAQDGLLENLVLRPHPDATISAEIGAPAFMIIAGERRWHAIGKAQDKGLLPLDWPVPHSLREVDEVTARRLALVENLQRRDLKPLEEARALQQLVDLDGRSTADIAQDIGFTQRWAQQRLQLLQLSPAMQQLLQDGRLKIEGARTVLAIWDKLPTIKRAELEAGKIPPDVAKAWLDQQPEPLSEAAMLAAMELYEKLAKSPIKAGYGGKAVKIVGGIERVDRGENGVTIKVRVDDPKGAFEELRKANIIETPGRVTEEGVETGEAYVSTGYNGEYWLKQRFASALDAKFRKSSIPPLRVRVYGLQVDYAAGKSGGYATPWLETPPFTPTAEVAAEIEKKRAARIERERQAAEAEEKRAEARREAERQKKARLDASAALEPELREAITVDTRTFTGLLNGKAQELGFTLPLFLDTDGEVIDAAGVEVVERCYSYQREERLPFLRFLVGAVNVAAGLETPTVRPVEMDPDALPREEFLAKVVDDLIEDTGEEDAPPPMLEHDAEDVAARALDAMLADEGWVYGEADAYDWDADGASSLAGAIQRGEYDAADQLDIEDAIGTDEEDDGAVEGRKRRQVGLE